ncbi:hypothetical protein HK099_003517 [Clydaea vesicula]|uniref:Uncharacterized protein n=1 Tax=Clydaea vesicula TaxID=447962 RepID=A0AAD5Y377_9FUNG|nr:hypothetical protein HK099_003517 [Clydaea vesicula]
MLFKKKEDSLENVNENESSETSYMKRKILNSTPGRVVRGDNLPFHLPTLRVRDGVFFGIGALIGPVVLATTAATTAAVSFQLAGVTGFIAGQVVHTAISEVVDHAVKIPIEYVFNKGNEHVIKSKFPKTNETEVLSERINLKSEHKLVDGEAILKFWYLFDEPVRGLKYYPDISKGWFNPYLYSTQRLPLIDRFSNPDFIEFFGPMVPYDYIFPVDYLKENHIYGNVSSFLKLENTSKYAFVFGVIGLSPFRGMWSQCRRPNNAELYFHILTQVPCLVVPLKNVPHKKDNPPIFSWYSRTISDLQTFDENEVKSESDCIIKYLEKYLDYSEMNQQSFEDSKNAVECNFIGSFREFVKEWFAGVVNACNSAKEFKNDFDITRAG